MQNGTVMRVVKVARVRHAPIDQGGMMRRKLATEHEHIGLRRTTPFPHEIGDFGNRLGRRPG